MKAAIYARVSTEEQVDGYSIDAQLRACRALCTERHWLVAAEYVDEGRSARTDAIAKRPRFQAMLAEVEAGGAQVIVVHKLDRFSRNLRITLETFERLASNNVAFVSVVEAVDYTTPHGKLFLHMLGALAQWYSDNLSQETRKGKAERKRQGMYNGLLPFGYAKGSDGIPVAHPHNAAGIQMAFDLSGSSLSDREVAQRLNAAGYRTTGNRGHNPFTKDSIRPMLMNPFYLGELPGGVQGKHEPIITRDVWDKAQQMRAYRRNLPNLTVTPQHTRYALTGLLRCWDCEQSGDPGRGRMSIYRESHTIRAYCAARKQGLPCEMQSCNVAIYEQQVEDWLGTLELPADAVTRTMALLDEEEKLAPRQVDERKRIENRLKRIQDIYGWGDMTIQEYQAERDALRKQLAAIETVAPRRENLTILADRIRNPLKHWQDSTAEQRNDMMALLVRSIAVRNGEVMQIRLQPIAALLLGCPEVVNTIGEKRKRRGTTTLDPVRPRRTPKVDRQDVADLAMTTSIRHTARELGISRQTVRKALETDGLGVGLI